MGQNNTDDGKRELFFPFYINQGRLLDLFAILNDGYFEYSEISTSLNVSESNAEKGKSAGDGFRVLEIGKTDYAKTDSTVKKVQTVTSILSSVKRSLADRGYLCTIEDVKAGSFICLPVNLKINSVKALLEEVSGLLKLLNTIQSTNKDIKARNDSVREFESVLKMIKPLFGGDEVVYENSSYAIIGNISDKNLYQSNKDDLIGIELKCLCQVKRVFPHGTELMRNTVFSKIKDHHIKEDLINQIRKLNDQDSYDFNIEAISSINGKPVYQVEIIALYQ